MSTLPQSATCTPIANDFSIDNANHVIQRFDLLEESLRSSTHRLQESRAFFQTFIEELNAKYALNLTIHSACLLVRDHLAELQLSPETQNILLDTIALLTADPTLVGNSFENAANMVALSAYWPWEWNWFGLNKKTSQPPKSMPTEPVAPLLLQASGDGVELPGSVYVGGMEALAGALVFTLGLVFPPAYGVGSALLVDGTRRVFNGLEEMDKGRSANWNQPPNRY